MSEAEYFEYDSLVDLLKGLYERKKQKNSLFSLTSWSGILGYNNSSYLAQCLLGERTINSNLLKQIIRTEQPSIRVEELMTFLFMKHNCRDTKGLPFDRIEVKLRKSFQENIY